MSHIEEQEEEVWTQREIVFLWDERNNLLKQVGRLQAYLFALAVVTILMLLTNG